MLQSAMTVYLIGGAPCTGKSTYASQLAHDLSCSWISTDIIRDFMRTVMSPKDFPDFFYAELPAEEFYTKFQGNQVFENELRESELTQPGVSNFIKKLESYGHWDKYVIEGIALTPLYMENLQKEFPAIVFTRKILFMDDIAEIRKRIFTRGLWDDAENYPDWIKEREIEWVLDANRWFKEEAEKYSIEVN